MMLVRFNKVGELSVSGDGRLPCLMRPAYTRWRPTARVYTLSSPKPQAKYEGLGHYSQAERIRLEVAASRREIVRSYLALTPM